MSQKIKLALLVHEGSAQTNRKAIEQAILEGKLNASIEIIIADKEADLSPLDSLFPDFICLAGWKKIISEEFLQKYKNRILNIHPGLIPESMDGTVKNPDNTDALWNKGKYGEKAVQNFLDQKSTYAGSSIHFLTEEFDFGPVLGRVFEKINDTDDVESLYARLKKKENDLYVEVLARLCQTN